MSTTEDLRTTQLADTRERIALATIDVIRRQGAAQLSFPAVAEQAGVSLRTVYRHFPNKEELVMAAVHAGAARTKQLLPRETTGIKDMRELLPLLWVQLEQQRDLVEVQHATPAGVAVRGARLQDRKDQVDESLARDFPDITPADRERLADIVTVLMASTLLFDLVDHLGLAVEDAAAMAAYTIEAVVDRARREGGIR